MERKIYSVITGTGTYIPSKLVKNEDFLASEFYDTSGKKLDKPNSEIIDKFEEISTIAERRYASSNQVTSDLAGLAGGWFFRRLRRRQTVRRAAGPGEPITVSADG